PGRARGEPEPGSLVRPTAVPWAPLRDQPVDDCPWPPFRDGRSSGGADLGLPSAPSVALARPRAPAPTRAPVPRAESSGPPSAAPGVATRPSSPGAAPAAAPEAADAPAAAPAPAPTATCAARAAAWPGLRRPQRAARQAPDP